MDHTKESQPRQPHSYRGTEPRPQTLFSLIQRPELLDTSLPTSQHSTEYIRIHMGQNMLRRAAAGIFQTRDLFKSFWNKVTWKRSRWKNIRIRVLRVPPPQCQNMQWIQYLIPSEGDLSLMTLQGGWKKISLGEILIFHLFSCRSFENLSRFFSKSKTDTFKNTNKRAINKPISGGVVFSLSPGRARLSESWQGVEQSQGGRGSGGREALGIKGCSGEPPH